MKHEKELDRVFSIYIRKRDEGKGCISCGQRLKFDTCDAGHYVPRTHKATRWHEDNVHGQCYSCNRLKDGNIELYRARLIQRIGLGRVEAIEYLRHATVKISDNEIKDLIKKYKTLNKEL